MHALERDVQRTVLKLLERLDSPRSLTAWLMVKHGMWKDLVSLRCDPFSYEPLYHDGVNRYRRDAQATELLRKCDGLATGINTLGVTMKGFYASEAQCKASNARLDKHLEFPVFNRLEMLAESHFVKAAKWIASVLGPVPQFLDGKFGPGAGVETSKWRRGRRRVSGLTAYDKLHFAPSCTLELPEELIDHAVWQTKLAGCWGAASPDRSFSRVRGNRLIVIKKDATKGRPICPEAVLNSWIQLSLGAAIKQRLKRIGLDAHYHLDDDAPLDLRSGQGIHRALAREASIDGNSATIDLSNASDTVSYAIVRKLLPHDWFELLNSCRSTHTEVVHPSGKKSWVRLEKFSSMGNGYTFELETLIFAALAHSVGGSVGNDTFVYGDDIIVPTTCARDLMALLQYSGFTPNMRKTFLSGHFRESCGGDFMCGMDVRPYYIKELPCDPSDWLSIANGLWRISRSWNMPELMAARNSALDNLPVPIRRCRGPEALGDVVVSEDDESLWSYTTRSSIRYFRVWRPVSKRKRLYFEQRYKVDGKLRVFSKPNPEYNPQVHLVAALLGLPSDGLTPRDAVTGFRFGRIAYS